MEKVAALHDLTHLFESFASKPDIIIDDMPSTTRAPFEFDVHTEGSWEITASTILKRHIDRR